MEEAGAAGTPAAGSGRRHGDVERVWLVVLQQLADSVAHELRNALNGVAVNLEVVRSRSGRDGVAASALGSFASSASDQLEAVIQMTDALMTLSRPPHDPAVIGRTADLVAALVRPPLAATGGSLDVIVEGEGNTRIPAEAARLFVAAALRAAVAATVDSTAGSAPGGALHCRVRPADGGGGELAVNGAMRRTPLLDESVWQLAKAYGVGVVPAESSITLTFPA